MSGWRERKGADFYVSRNWMPNSPLPVQSYNKLHCDSSRRWRFSLWRNWFWSTQFTLRQLYWNQNKWKPTYSKVFSHLQNMCSRLTPSGEENRLYSSETKRPQRKDQQIMTLQSTQNKTNFSINKFLSPWKLTKPYLHSFQLTCSVWLLTMKEKQGIYRH